jgi:hypothetical protein
VHGLSVGLVVLTEKKHEIYYENNFRICLAVVFNSFIFCKKTAVDIACKNFMKLYHGMKYSCYTASSFFRLL